MKLLHSVLKCAFSCPRNSFFKPYLDKMSHFFATNGNDAEVFNYSRGNPSENADQKFICFRIWNMTFENV